MIEVSSLGDVASLPPAPPGWFDYRYCALADGNLALIRTRTDIQKEYRRRGEAAPNEGLNVFQPDLWQGEIRLSIFDGRSETDVTFVPPRQFPIVDKMVDGRWLIVSSRAASCEKNATIIGIDGKENIVFRVGDGVQTVLSAPDGSIWVGYFDEGVFASPEEDGTAAISGGGIVRFDANGHRLWSLNDDGHSLPNVDDVYAMTTSGNALWACYYSDFPIVRVADGNATVWTNTITGAGAIAVDNDLVLLAGGYGADVSRIAVLQVGAGVAKQMGSLRYARSASQGVRLMQGRGHVLHLVTNGTWARVSVSDAAATIGSR